VDNSQNEQAIEALKEENTQLSNKVTALEERMSSLENWQKEEQGIRPATTDTKPQPQAQDEPKSEDSDWDELNQYYAG
jgi:cell division protein FtsB